MSSSFPDLCGLLPLPGRIFVDGPLFRLLDGVLCKRTDSVLEIWQDRQVVLTEKCIYFGIPVRQCQCFLVQHSTLRVVTHAAK